MLILMFLYPRLQLNILSFIKTHNITLILSSYFIICFRAFPTTVHVHLIIAYLHQVRFQIRMVALVQTQVLMAIPVPNMENRLIFSTIRLGRFLMVHSGIGLLV